MKHLSILLLMVLCTFSSVAAQVHDTLPQSQQKTSVIKVNKTGDTVTTTISTTSKGVTDDPELQSLANDENIDLSENDLQELKELLNSVSHVAQPALTGIIIVFLVVFLLPITIIAIILIFRYKSRKEKYRLMEIAIKHGQSIPDCTIKAPTMPNSSFITTQLYSKGLKQILIGIALFIFLWAVTNEFAIGCIGLFIVALGVEKLFRYKKMCELEKMSQMKKTEEESQLQESAKESKDE